MKTEELLALLREAKRLVAANRLMLGHYSGVREVGSLEDRIDAALAEADKPVEVEWKPIGDDQKAFEAYPDADTGLDVFRFDHDLGYWRWMANVEREATGRASTLEEAKAAAVEAAKRLR